MTVRELGQDTEATESTDLRVTSLRSLLCSVSWLASGAAENVRSSCSSVHRVKASSQSRCRLGR